MELVLERRHPAREEAAVLADRVAAHRRGLRRHVLGAGTRAPRARRRPRRASRPCTLVDEPGACRACPCSTRPSPSSTASSWCTTQTGASATVASSLSVTTSATSMMRSLSGLRPVISRSIQIRRLASWGMLNSRRIGRTLSHIARVRPAAHQESRDRLPSSPRLFVAALARLARAAALARAPARRGTSPRTAMRVPAAFADRIGLPAHQKAADYTVARTRFGVVETLFEAGVLLALTLGGGLAALVRADRRARHWRPLGRDLALDRRAGAASAARSACRFRWHRTFGIEARFGFNRTTPRLWVADLVKGVAVGAAARPAARGAGALADARGRARSGGCGPGRSGSASSSCCWCSTRRSSRRCSTSSRRCPRAPRATRSRRCSRAAASRTRGLFVMDGSRRSSHGNAFFTGFGRGEAHRVLRHAARAPRRPTRSRRCSRTSSATSSCSHVLKRMALDRRRPRSRSWRCSRWLAASPWFYAGLGVPPVAGRARRRADPVLPRAAGVHVPAGAAVRRSTRAGTSSRPTRSPRATRRPARSCGRW